MINYTKEELEKLIFEEKISYIKLGKINNVSDTYIKKYAEKLGIKLPKRAEFPEKWVPFNKGKTIITNIEGDRFYSHDFKKECIVCRNTIKTGKFCSTKCMGENRKNESFQKYKKAVEDNIDISKYSGMHIFKRYILDEQNNKCAICNISDIWNGQKLTLVLDHIDGNASNNKRSNLRCVCPNCDSQLPTFKSRNKNSARKERYLKNYKN